jgi:hypothetical protein
VNRYPALLCNNCNRNSPACECTAEMYGSEHDMEHTVCLHCGSTDTFLVGGNYG